MADSEHGRRRPNKHGGAETQSQGGLGRVWTQSRGGLGRVWTQIHQEGPTALGGKRRLTPEHLAPGRCP